MSIKPNILKPIVPINRVSQHKMDRPPTSQIIVGPPIATKLEGLETIPNMSSTPILGEYNNYYLIFIVIMIALFTGGFFLSKPRFDVSGRGEMDDLTEYSVYVV